MPAASRSKAARCRRLIPFTCMAFLPASWLTATVVEPPFPAYVSNLGLVRFLYPVCVSTKEWTEPKDVR